MSLSDSPKYINGIPVRTIGGDLTSQTDDFLEEKEAQRGIFTVRTDGFCLRQGADIISHMDKRGSFHPRRYIMPFDFGFSTAQGSFQTVNVIVCEDGPRITMSFPQIGPLSQIPADSIVVHNVSTKLPVLLCPTVERGPVNQNCFEALTKSDLSIVPLISLFSIVPTGYMSFSHPGSVYTISGSTISGFSITYDTGRP